MTDIAKWLCEKPAILPGLQKVKGKIQNGYDADLVVWDPEESFIVSEGIIHHKHKITPYINEKLNGVVKQTYLKGKKVFDNGEFVLHKGLIELKYV